MKIRTKIIAILLCVFSVAAALALGGCDLSAKPTKSKVRKIALETYNIKLPESIELINYATDVGFDGGIWYCVFSYDYSDEEFNSLFKEERDDEFESKFLNKKQNVVNSFNNDYEYPDLKEDYKWIYASDISSNGRRKFELMILYFDNINELVVIDNTIQVTNTDD